MWTEKQLQQLKQQGNIKGYKSPAQKTGNNIPPVQKRSKEKEWLSWNLMYWANEHGLLLETEYQFDEKRKWRFDWAFPAVLTAVEYEGLFRKDKGKTGHTSITGVMRDIEKYNRAAELGWTIIRVAAHNYKSVHQILNKLTCQF